MTSTDQKQATYRKPRLGIDLGQEWSRPARCVDVDPEIFFSNEDKDNRQAKAICNRCPAQPQCLAYAINTNEQHGIWGGATQRERRIIHKEQARRRLKNVS